MEIAPINVLSATAGTLAALVLFVVRFKKGAPEAQVGWALLGGAGVGGSVKAIYPVYRIILYHTLDGVDDLWLYAYVGSFAILALGVAAVVTAWKAP